MLRHNKEDFTQGVGGRRTAVSTGTGSAVMGFYSRGWGERLASTLITERASGNLWLKHRVESVDGKLIEENLRGSGGSGETDFSRIFAEGRPGGQPSSGECGR